jgi:DNA primase
LRFTSHPIILPYYLGSRAVYLQGRLVGNGDGTVTRYLNVRGDITHAYNHDALTQSTDTVYICEGVTDVLSMSELGYENVVGIPGANNFHPDWFIGFRGKRVVLALDNDKAGVAAAGRIGNYAQSRGLIVERFALPDGVKDINQLLMKQRGLA